MKIILILILFNLGLFGQAHYVSKTGSSIPPYSSWATAADSIYKAVGIAQDGDTIMIANGRYRENFEVENELCFLGMSRDSTIIDGQDLNSSSIIVKKNCSFSKLGFIGKAIEYGEIITILESTADSITISNCNFESANTAISSIGSINCDNLNIINCVAGIDLADLSMLSTAKIKDCSFEIIRHGIGISLSHYGDLIVESCVFNPISLNGLNYAVHAVFEMKSLNFKNNIVNSAKNRGIYMEFVQSRPLITNNFFGNQWEDDLVTYAAIFSVKSNQPIITNNVFYNCLRAIYLQGNTNYPQIIDYNCFWGNTFNVVGATPGENNIELYPMFIDDPERGYEEEFDVHLQMYSPLIDKGDTTIIDLDGTRSDIGAYGGQGGESYPYFDHAPNTPTNFNLNIADSVFGLSLSWEDNNESDFKEYRVYRSFDVNIQPVPENLLETEDVTLFIDTQITGNLNYYYILTAIDSTGNESTPTTKVTGRITSVEKDEKIEPGYQLNQNYPNPFNPRTLIEYQLEKESRVSLEVLNVQGERVEVLAKGIQSKGNHSVVFDGSKLASGVYLYRLRVKDETGKTIYSQGNKMLLLK